MFFPHCETWILSFGLEVWRVNFWNMNDLISFIYVDGNSTTSFLRNLELNNFSETIFRRAHPIRGKTLFEIEFQMDKQVSSVHIPSKKC